jgi:hypothetical protein
MCTTMPAKFGDRVLYVGYRIYRAARIATTMMALLPYTAASR